MGHPFMEITTDVPHLLPKPPVTFYTITHQTYCCNLFGNPSFNLLLLDFVTCEHHHKMHFTDQVILEGFQLLPPRQSAAETEKKIERGIIPEKKHMT